jgi:hypothetical protein
MCSITERRFRPPRSQARFGPRDIRERASTSGFTRSIAIHGDGLSTSTTPPSRCGSQTRRRRSRGFLWQHLGVDPGTDLDALYRRAIGVPQGTFTAIFLETPAERKKAFDKLLKVEEYRRGAEELLKTTRFIEQQTPPSVNASLAPRARSRGSILSKRSTRLLLTSERAWDRSWKRSSAMQPGRSPCSKTLDEAEAELITARTSLESSSYGAAQTHIFRRTENARPRARTRGREERLRRRKPI